MGLFSSSRNSTSNTTDIDVHSNPVFNASVDASDGIARAAVTLKDGLMNTSALAAFAVLASATLFIIGRK